jgi:hypothetical protein
MRRSVGLLVILLLMGLNMTTYASPEVGYLWSEHNAAKYNWLRQDIAIETLELFGIKCDKLSDKDARDPQVLSRYKVITASTVYTLPDDVVEALIEYVKGGGKLVFGDAPVAVANPELAKVLGFEGASQLCYYMKNAKFAPTDKSKLDFNDIPIESGAMNAYVSKVLDTAEVWMQMEGPMALSTSKTVHEERSIPGIVVNKYGKGLGILLNWSIFATGDISVQYLYAETILWALEQ